MTDKLEDNKIIADRKEKLEFLSKVSKPYIIEFTPTHLAKAINEKYNILSNEKLVLDNIKVKVAGRIMLKRLMGNASFVSLQDSSGKIQLFITKNNIDADMYNEQFKKWDIGDIIGIEGILFKTKTGELTIKAMSIDLLTKSLRPLPEKFHGLANKELIYRKRYVDLIVNEQSKKTFITRSIIISYIRQFFTKLDFLEVETPIMNNIVGGANAKPFITHHNALDIKLYLRIAPELYLKRLIVGGFDKVFEIGRNFRNEGISIKHNPEFTAVEFYQAYKNTEYFINLTEKLIKELAVKIIASNKEEIKYQDYKIDFSTPFRRLTMSDSILEHNKDLSENDLTNKEKIISYAKKNNISVDDKWSLSKLKVELFSETVEKNIINPTFITEYPIEQSPLSKRSIKNYDIADRFELFIAGKEMANGFAELNDPQDQKERFNAQVELLKQGDEESMHYDSDFIEALEYGMPPTVGTGIGIDRLVMLLTNSKSIRDVILFPLLRLE